VEIPQEIQDDMELLFVSHVKEVFELALKPGPKQPPRKRKPLPGADQAQPAGM
jgi:ATP-dependent Lon protease